MNLFVLDNFLQNKMIHMSGESPACDFADYGKK